jgi:CO/xanthine dehydrogenase Mo-binding subunit
MSKGDEPGRRGRADARGHRAEARAGADGGDPGVGGHIRNPSFTDYLLPTALDIPAVRLDILEIPRADSPYRLTGVGEPSLVSCPPAIVAAIRDACGRELSRIPARPDAIAGT